MATIRVSHPDSLQPTQNGEIWVYNKQPPNATQYIPLSVYELHGWLGSPAIYVLECSNAATLFSAFTQLQEQRESARDSASSGHNAQDAAPLHVRRTTAPSSYLCRK